MLRLPQQDMISSTDYHKGSLEGHVPARWALNRQARERSALFEQSIAIVGGRVCMIGNRNVSAEKLPACRLVEAFISFSRIRSVDCFGGC